MQIKGLCYVGIESPKYREWETFGPEIFGFQVGSVGPDGTLFLRLDDRAARIIVHPGPKDQLAYIGWQLTDSKDWEDAVEELSSAGVAVEVAKEEQLEERHVAGLARFQDPWGFQHELIYGQKYSPGSFTPGRPLFSRFVSDDNGIGHVVYAVPHLTQKERNFFLRTLNFRPYLEQPMGMWYRPWNSKRHSCLTQLHIPNKRGLQHLMVEVESIDDVGRAYDAVLDRGVPVQLTLGRHGPDPIISFYCVTPSGFILEYGCSGGVIDEGDYSQKTLVMPAEIWGHRPGDFRGLPTTVEDVSP